jgi:inhibitor of cysteine peptidase
MECRSFLKAAKLSVIAIMLPVMMTAGCGSRVPRQVALEGDMDISIKKGGVLEISIESNPTTGYLWSLEGFSGTDVLASMGKYKYVRLSDRLGAGGKQIYSFKAVKKGNARLIFEYRREWEKKDNPEKRYTAKVTVN